MIKKLKIKRIDKTIDLPKYHTKGSVAFDFYSRIEVIVKPKEIKYIPLGVCIQLPKGYTLIMAPRSSLHKKGLVLINSIAVFDEDFCGDSDEYHTAVYNFSSKAVKIEKGDRLTQGLLIPVLKCEWKEVKSMNSKDRGGFGSTGRS